MGNLRLEIHFVWIGLVVIASTQSQRSTFSTSLHKQEPTGSGGKYQNSLTRQSQSAAEMLKHYQARLKRLGNLEIEPAVWIGASAPDDAGKIQDRALAQRKDRPPHPHRRTRSQNEALSEEICKTNRYWKQINVTRNILGEEVRIIHTEEYRQFTFVYECSREGERCNGTLAGLNTICEMRQGWAYMMYHKTVGDNDIAEWNYVEVPNHCACKVIPVTSPFIFN